MLRSEIVMVIENGELIDLGLRFPQSPFTRRIEGDLYRLVKEEKRISLTSSPKLLPSQRWAEESA